VPFAEVACRCGTIVAGYGRGVGNGRCLVHALASIHNDGMNVSRKILVLLAALATLSATSLALGACGEEQVDADPQEVLDTASAKMKQLAGFHFVYELHQPESAKRAEGVQKVEADFNAEGEMQATLQQLVSGSLLNVEVVALADTHYVLLPLGTDWLELSPADSPLTKLNLSEGPTQIMDNITSVSLVGIEKRQGMKTYHLTGNVTKEDIETIVGTVSTADVFVADLWIGVDDSLLYEVDVDGPMTDNEPEGTWRSITLSDLGVAVDIEPPQ